MQYSAGFVKSPAKSGIHTPLYRSAGAACLTVASYGDPNTSRRMNSLP